MNADYPHHSLYPLPQLSDEAVIEIREFLEMFFLVFDERYGGHIHRYYDDRSRQDINPAHPITSTDDHQF